MICDPALITVFPADVMDTFPPLLLRRRSFTTEMLPPFVVLTRDNAPTADRSNVVPAVTAIALAAVVATLDWLLITN